MLLRDAVTGNVVNSIVRPEKLVNLHRQILDYQARGRQHSLNEVHGTPSGLSKLKSSQSNRSRMSRVLRLSRLEEDSALQGGRRLRAKRAEVSSHSLRSATMSGPTHVSNLSVTIPKNVPSRTHSQGAFRPVRTNEREGRAEPCSV